MTWNFWRPCHTSNAQLMTSWHVLPSPSRTLMIWPSTTTASSTHGPTGKLWPVHLHNCAVEPHRLWPICCPVWVVCLCWTANAVLFQLTSPHWLKNARNQSINFREQFAALKVRLDSDDVADAHEFFGDILDVLLNAVYVVSIAVHVHSTGLESKFIRLFLLYRLLILWLSSSSKLHQPHLKCIPKPNTGCWVSASTTEQMFGVQLIVFVFNKTESKNRIKLSHCFVRI